MMEQARADDGAPHPPVDAAPPCVTVDKGVPIPPVDRRRSGRKIGWSLPWRLMEIGDSFRHPVMAGDPGAHATRSAREASVRTGYRFVVRRVEEDGCAVFRIWRVA